MLPAYDKQSGTLLDEDEDEDDSDEDAVAALLVAAAEPDDDDVAPDDDPVPDADLVVRTSGMTPRQRGMQALMTPRRLQHGL